MTTIGERVRAEREARGLKLNELAKMIGDSYSSTISELESGRSRTTKKLRLIAEALGVSLEWLETGRGSKFPRTATEVVGVAESAPPNYIPLDAYRSASDKTRAAVDLLLLPAHERHSFTPKVHGAIDTLEDEAQAVLAARGIPGAATATPRLVGR